MMEAPSEWKAIPLHDRPIGIVSGYMRSGTSMMMRALGEGGMGLAYEESRDAMNEQHGDDEYKPNGDGFFELHRRHYQENNFPEQYRGLTIKCLLGGLMRLPVKRYFVVFMMRDAEEIRQSHEAFFGTPAMMQGKPFSSLLYHSLCFDAIARLKNRRDTTVNVFHYREVVERPAEHFEILAASGWPIDAAKAASIVEPDKCRFRKEELTVGL